jgi:hypothetical protein
MDERLLERLITRSCTSVWHPGAFVLSFSSLVFSALIWATLRTLIAGIEGILRAPLFFLTASISLLPIALVIVPLATWYLGSRSGQTPFPFDETVRRRWKHSIALLLCAVGCVAVELVFGLCIAIWCGLEAIPLIGLPLYLVFSWIPTVLTLLMGLWFALACIIVLFIGASLAQTPSAETVEFWTQMPHALPIEWLIRFKLMLIGIIPSAIWYVACISWTMVGLPSSVEFCASLLRMLVFAAIEAPLFLFLIHMTVEADRYVTWLSSRRMG